MANAIQDFLQIIRVAFERGHLTPRSLLVSGAALALLIRLIFKQRRPRYISNLDKVGRRVGSNTTARDEKWEYDIIIVGGGIALQPRDRTPNQSSSQVLRDVHWLPVFPKTRTYVYYCLKLEEGMSRFLCFSVTESEISFIQWTRS